jgi:hypothetical protein
MTLKILGRPTALAEVLRYRDPNFRRRYPTLPKVLGRTQQPDVLAQYHFDSVLCTAVHSVSLSND